MSGEQVMALQEEIDQSAVKLQKSIGSLFALSLVLLLQAYMFMYDDFYSFTYGIGIIWIVLACGFKGALRRRPCQLFLYNLLSLVVVFIVTFFYTYSSYNLIHEAIVKHTGATNQLICIMVMVGVSYLYWMILTVISMIRATQIFILSRFLKHELAKEQEDIEMQISPSSSVTKTTESQSQSPIIHQNSGTDQVIVYYPLSAPGTDFANSADGNNYVDFSAYQKQ